MDRRRNRKNLWLTKWVCAAALIGVLAVTSKVHAAKPAPAPPAPSGHELFHRDWSEKVPFTSLDGIGPMYNAVSCVACHHQGGPGGGGSNNHNVQLLTITTMPVPAEEAMAQVDLKSLRETPLHPALATTSSVVLHRYSTNPNYYAMLRMWDARPQVQGIGNLVGLESLGINRAQFAHQNQNRTAARAKHRAES